MVEEARAEAGRIGEEARKMADQLVAEKEGIQIPPVLAVASEARFTGAI
jgi:hypothetical protein